MQKGFKTQKEFRQVTILKNKYDGDYLEKIQSWDGSFDGTLTKVAIDFIVGI